MNEILEELSTREISILCWSILIFSILIFIARKEFLNVLKALFHYKIVASFLAFGIYCTIVIFILYKINYWDIHLLKDTFIWFFSAGLIVFFNINKINKTNYFLQIFKDNIKVLLFLEFLLNFYTFGLVTELIIVPLVTFITIMYEYSKYSMIKNPEHVKVNKFLKSILSFFGSILLLFVLVRSVNDYKNLLTIYNIKSLYLPLILTVLTFPFYYLLALVMIYEDFFVQINFMFLNKKIKREFKKQVLINAHINLNRLTKIKTNFIKKEICDDNIAAYIKTIK